MDIFFNGVRRLAGNLKYVVIIWMFLFDVSFNWLGSFFSSRKLVLVFLFFYYLYIKKRSNENVFKDFSNYLLNNKRIIIIIITTLVISMLSLFINHNFIDGNAYTYNRLLYVLATVIIGTFFIQFVFSDINTFIKSFIGAILIEGITALLQFLFVPIKNFYDIVFFQSGNLPYTTYYRAVGIGCEGALLSLYLSIGFILCLYYIYNKISIVKYSFFALFLFIINMFTGKTGFFINLFTIILYTIVIIVKRKPTLDFFKKNSRVIVLLIICATGIFFIFSQQLLFSNQWVFNAFERTTQIFTKGLGDDSIQDLIFMFSQTNIPLNIWIFGSGITYGVTSTGVSFLNDSGYIKSLFGYGLPLAVAFYYIIYSDIYTKIRQIKISSLNVTLLYITVIFLVSELKEPFTLKGPVIFLVVALSSIFLKNKEIT